jgi:hypothetical protein
MPRVKLSRDQLASFLTDPDQIKQFENLLGLANLMPVENGGTGATNAADARANLSAAKLGNNSDITSLIGLTGGIKTPSYIDFDPLSVDVDQQARSHWSATDRTLNIGLGSAVVLSVGQDLFAIVKNDSGALIAKGNLVSVTGADSGRLRIGKYIADGTIDPLTILGVLAQDIADGSTGFCQLAGSLSIDTSAFAAGDTLYASASVAGALTNISPVAPNRISKIGHVLSASASGAILINQSISQAHSYGQFVKTTSTTPAVINTAYPIDIDARTIGDGVTIGTPVSRMVFAKKGLYQFGYTVQLKSTSAAVKNVWVWWRKNGVDIADSATVTALSLNNEFRVTTGSAFFNLAANDYLELCWASSLTAVSIEANAATAFAPAASALILDIVQIQQ